MTRGPAQATANLPVETRIACPNCSYNLTGVPIGSRCPECGLLIGRGTFAAMGMPISGVAIASLVLGILSIIGCASYGILSLPCGIIAIALATRVKHQIARQDVSPASAGVAKAGLVCGIIGLCVGAMILVLTLLMFGLALS